MDWLRGEDRDGQDQCDFRFSAREIVLLNVLVRDERGTAWGTLGEETLFYLKQALSLVLLLAL